ESLELLEKSSLHPKAKETLLKAKPLFRNGDFTGAALDRRNMVAISLLDEVTKRQRAAMETSQKWQILRGKEIALRMSTLSPYELEVLRKPAFLKALNKATEHPSFNLAAHLAPYIRFLRATAAFSGKRESDIKGFPEESVSAFLTLAQDPKFDFSSAVSITRYKKGLNALERYEHPDLWKWFGQNPVLFAKVARFANTMPPEDVQRILRGFGRKKKVSPEQLNLLPPEHLWHEVLAHPAIIVYLRKYAGRAAHPLVVNRIPEAMKKIGKGQKLDGIDEKSIYALGAKVAAGVEGRLMEHERFSLRSFERGQLNPDVLEKFRLELNRIMFNR
ncbi:MAG: hypothetical protein V1658_00760, partial [Candidatus Micrarchaeota archaeon]